MSDVQVVTPGNLGPDFIANSVAKQYELRPDLVIGASVDAATKSLVFKQRGGTTISVPLAAIDIHVTQASYDAATYQLTLIDTENSTIIVDLTELAKTQTATSLTVAIAGDGSSAAPLEANVLIDPASDASLSISSSGLLANVSAVVNVPLYDAFGVLMGHIAP